MYPAMKKLEIILSSLSIIALCMYLLIMPYSQIITVITLSAFALMYFYLSFALFNDFSIKQIFKKESYRKLELPKVIFAIAAGVVLSIIIVGIIDALLSWKSGNRKLIIGLACILSLLIIAIVIHYITKSAFYKPILKRAAIFSAIGLTLLLLQKTTLQEIKYRHVEKTYADKPDYLTALKKVMADPDNKELWEEVGKEQAKYFNR